MTPRERILRTLAGEPADRPPILGGFVMAPGHYRRLAGVTAAEFWADPQAAAIAAYRALEADALLMLPLPPGRRGHRQYRGMTAAGFHSHERRFRSAEDVRDFAEALPSQEESLRQFDQAAWRRDLLAGIARLQEALGEILYLPTQWDVVHPTFEHFNAFGYGNYMEFLGLYPQAAERLFGHQTLVHRRRAEIVVEVWRQLDLPPVVHIGSDICGKGGPVVSPEFLRRHYLPFVEAGLAPLVRAGFTTVWHADGRIEPIVHDLLACGVGGFQGFQWEYGVDLSALVRRRTARGAPLAIFAGPSTSATLPFGSAADVRAETGRIRAAAAGRCRLFWLEANCVLPDTPLANLRAYYRAAKER